MGSTPFGFVAGLDLRRPALKLPGWGRIGMRSAERRSLERRPSTPPPPASPLVAEPALAPALVDAGALPIRARGRVVDALAAAADVALDHASTWAGGCDLDVETATLAVLPGRNGRAGEDAEPLAPGGALRLDVALAVAAIGVGEAPPARARGLRSMRPEPADRDDALVPVAVALLAGEALALREPLQPARGHRPRNRKSRPRASRQVCPARARRCRRAGCVRRSSRGPGTRAYRRRRRGRSRYGRPPGAAAGWNNPEGEGGEEAGNERAHAREMSPSRGQFYNLQMNSWCDPSANPSPTGACAVTASAPRSARRTGTGRAGSSRTSTLAPRRGASTPLVSTTSRSPPGASPIDVGDAAEVLDVCRRSAPRPPRRARGSCGRRPAVPCRKLHCGVATLAPHAREASRPPPARPST